MTNENNPYPAAPTPSEGGAFNGAGGGSSSPYGQSVGGYGQPAGVNGYPAAAPNGSYPGGMPGPGASYTVMSGPLAGVVPVSLGKRVAARLLDFLIIGVVGGIIGAILGLVAPNVLEDNANLVGQVVGLCFLLVLAFTGWYPGARLLRVRQVNVETGEPPKFWVILKYFLEGLFGLPLGIPILIVWFATRDESGRHWIDRVCHTIVIDCEAGRDPAEQMPTQAH